MFISSLHIERFRPFDKNDFKIGKYVTAIAGFNCTGKSTILGLLGHCGELKGYKPLLHSGFRAELSEIIKFSINHDDKIRDIGTITFEDLPNLGNSNYPSSLSYRSTWQKYREGKRYRIIPKKTGSRTTVDKITWPTLYLGLGRLYPVGESVIVKETPLVKKLSETEKKFILDNMDSILSTNEHPKDFTAASIQETPKKKAVGLNTDKYDYKCNSAGQDNLGQILLTVLSFRRLKEQLGDNWCGGLLSIDEVDATLHPLAQNKLMNFLFDQADDIGIQVVFTTNSLSLLNHICSKTSHNKSTETNKYELIYISNANGPIEVFQNPSFSTIYNDLMAKYYGLDSKKLDVFSEDREARILIKMLLEKHAHAFNLLDVHFGQNQLLDMLTADYNSFCRYIYVLDGDVEDDIIQQYSKKISPAKLDCMVKLPGGKRPEQVLWEYLENMPPDHQFLEWGRINFNYSKRSFTENGPFSDKYNGCDKDREKYKRWFNDNVLVVDNLFKYWLEDNKEIVEKFVSDFVAAYNWVAPKCFMPMIVP